MKILGIIASPRKKGNTEVLVRKVLGGARKKGAQIEVIFLNDLAIKPCQGCGECSEKGRCVQRDDMQILYRKFDQAEAIVLGTPVYMNNLSVQMKCFVDRCNALMEVVEQRMGPPKIISRLKSGKKAALIVICGSPLPDGAKDAMGHLREFCHWLGIQIAGELIGAGLNNVGDVEKRAELLEEAFYLGEGLSGKM